MPSRKGTSSHAPEEIVVEGRPYAWLRSRLQEFAAAIEDKAYEPPSCDIGDPASADDLVAVEKEIGRMIPRELREFFLEFASSISFSWTLPNESSEWLPDELSEVQFGEFTLSLKEVLSLLDGWELWQRSAFANPEPVIPGFPPYAFEDSFPIIGTLTGDLIVLASGGPKEGDVYFLGHDASGLHWYPLASSFHEFLNVWTRLGCVGPEDTCLEPFYDFSKECLSYTGETAEEWRRSVGI